VILYDALTIRPVTDRQLDSLQNFLEGARAMTRAVLSALSLLFIASAIGGAAEIATNGTGGGVWSDPATWRGKVVPGPRTTSSS